MKSTKYRHPPQAPPLFCDTPETLMYKARDYCDKTTKFLDSLVGSIKLEDATFQNVILPMAWREDETTSELRLIGFYQFVSADRGLRDASNLAEKMVNEFSIQVGMREDIFQLVEAVFQRKEKLDPESQRFLEKLRKGYLENGLTVPAGRQRDRFKSIMKRLSGLCSEFQKNLNEENGGVWCTAEELKGLPFDIINNLEKGSGEYDGKLKVSFKYPDLVPALKFVLNAETRRALFLGNENKEAMLLRDEAARLLGYHNWASFRIEDKMAKTPERVLAFLEDLKMQLIPPGRNELKHLARLKKTDQLCRQVNCQADNFYLWDKAFYERLMIEQEYDVEEELVSEYFPIIETIGRMLRSFELLFGLLFLEVEQHQRQKLGGSENARFLTWHDDVKMFTVWDSENQGNTFVGYLYLDLHPRPGKYSHGEFHDPAGDLIDTDIVPAANFGLQPGFLRPNKVRRYPATSLVCNFSKPTPQKPSLLKHHEVVTLFHELGHGIHDLVSHCTYSRFHGTLVVQDFVEAPSQMLENWCWDPRQLKALSQHYQTGEKIPTNLAIQLTKTKHVNGALGYLRQLHFGIFDMMVHTPKSHNIAKGIPYAEIYNRLNTQITGLEGIEQAGEIADSINGHANFGHLFGGYDAGYYGYLSSQVYSADMYHAFFAEAPMNPEAGRRYRRMVLEKGGSQDEMKTLEDFLGRSVSSQAFCDELGIEWKNNIGDS